MAFPVPKVEIAFDDGPYVASPTWTDVTADVRELSTDRGRSDDWGYFDGSASVVLNNNARKYDPFYTSGVYYGKLLPRRQIRITATYGGTSYPVFRGFVAGWPPTWTNAGKDSTVTLSCFDALGLLASDSLPADWSHKYILSTSPRHYWPCNEPITPFTAAQVMYDYGSYPLNLSTSIYAQNGDQLAAGLVSTSLMGTSASSASGAGADSTNSDYSACFFAIFDPDTGYDPGGVQGNTVWAVSYEPATSTFLLDIYDYTSAPYYERRFRTVATFDGGTPRHIGFTFNITSKAVTFYVDGIAQTMTTLGTIAVLPFVFPESFNGGSGQIQQVVIWNSIQPQSVFRNIYQYSNALWTETTAARFTRLLAETQFPYTTMASAPSAPASTVLDLTDDAPMTTSELQRVADSEYAPLFVTRDGILTLYNQNQIRTQTRSIVSQATYGGGSGVNIGPEVTIAYDGDSMRNVANITMSQGGVYIKKNTTSIATYGSAEASVDTEVASLANAQAVANIVQGWGGQVYPKADPFDVVLSPDNSWASTLDRELNDRITLVITPPTGNTITTPMLLSRVSHSAVPGEWRTTFEGSARWAAVFILNQSTLGGTDLLG